MKVHRVAILSDHIVHYDPEGKRWNNAERKYVAKSLGEAVWQCAIRASSILSHKHVDVGDDDANARQACHTKVQNEKQKEH